MFRSTHPACEIFVNSVPVAPPKREPKKRYGGSSGDRGGGPEFDEEYYDEGSGGGDDSGSGSDADDEIMLDIYATSLLDEVAAFVAAMDAAAPLTMTMDDDDVTAPPAKLTLDEARLKVS